MVFLDSLVSQNREEMREREREEEQLIDRLLPETDTCTKMKMWPRK